MGWLRRIGLVLLVLAVGAVAWEPTRVGIQTALVLPNLLGAGVTPLSILSAPPRRSSIEYRPSPDGGEPELAELWLPSWASADRQAGAILLVLGVNNVGRNHVDAVPPREDEPDVRNVAAALALRGADVLRPAPAGLVLGSPDGHPTERHEVECTEREVAVLVGVIEAAKGDRGFGHR